LVQAEAVDLTSRDCARGVATLSDFESSVMTTSADHVSLREGTRWSVQNVVNASAVTSYFAPTHMGMVFVAFLVVGVAMPVLPRREQRQCAFVG
jgi:hypothetical protein